MNEDRIGLNVRSRAGNGGTIEPEIERLFRLVAEREAAQHTVAHDSVSVPLDLMTNVVESARQRLPDAGTVVAMLGSPHIVGNYGGTQQSLGIDRRLVRPRPDDVAETNDFTPCGGREQLPAPA